MIAFLSYSNLDWEAELDKKALQKLPRILESQVRAEIGSRDFSIWQDKDDLRWGDDWSEKIDYVISEADIFIAVISPGWFKSENCQQEFDTFIKSENTARKLLLPIIWRYCKTELLNSENQKRLDIINRVQCVDFRNHAHISDSDVSKKYKEISLCIAEKHVTEVKKLIPTKPVRFPKSFGGASTGSPIVSGGFTIPSQGDGWSAVKLVVAPVGAVETEFGELFFSISSLNLHAKPKNGKILEEVSRFGGAGFSGEAAHVFRAPSEEKEGYALTIIANEGVLMGEPLTDKGEAGYVEIFSCNARDDNAKQVISGYVEFFPQSIIIDEEESIVEDKIEDALSRDDKRSKSIKRKLAKLIIQKCANRIALHSSDEE